MDCDITAINVTSQQGLLHHRNKRDITAGIVTSHRDWEITAINVTSQHEL